jgi:endonuclease/exonuclease/phosphatase family metal-dependent hydrolase
MIVEFTAAKLLDMALGGIVGNNASEGVQRLWQIIRNRLSQNYSVMEAEIVKLEENPSQENLKPLEPFLQVEMHKDKLFAEEISKLAREIASQNSGDTINQGNFKAEGNAVVTGKIDAPNSRIGGSDTNITMGKH